MKKAAIIFLFLLPVLLTSCSNNLAEDRKLLLQGQLSFKQLASPVNTTNTTSPSFSEETVSINTAPLGPVIFNQNDFILKTTTRLTEEEIRQILEGRAQLIRMIGDNLLYKIKITAALEENLQQLQQNPLVEYIEPDYAVHIQNAVYPNDPEFSKQWNLEILDLPEIWSEHQSQEEIIVAVIDSGILPYHPDLQANIVAGYDFVDDDSDPTDTDPDFSHGTHVAGIIGAVSNNQLGIAGINWQVKIMPIRVIGEDGNGGYSALISGIYWAVDHGAQVINLSLAGTVDSPALQAAIQYAVQEGVTVVAAAGNNGAYSLLYPAKYQETISVGAIGPSQKRAYYSNYGPGLDLVAPGGDISDFSSQINTIISTGGYMTPQGAVYNYSYAQGTSMAAPHVSGLVSLLYAAGFDDPSSVKERLFSTADDLGLPGQDEEYGYGLVNIQKALGFEAPEQEPTKELAGVKIIAINEYGQLLETLTDEKGNFSFLVDPGTWTLKATLNLEGLILQAEKTLQVDKDSYCQLELN